MPGQSGPKETAWHTHQPGLSVAGSTRARDVCSERNDDELDSRFPAVSQEEQGRTFMTCLPFCGEECSGTAISLGRPSMRGTVSFDSSVTDSLAVPARAESSRPAESARGMTRVGPPVWSDGPTRRAAGSPIAGNPMRGYRRRL